MNFPIKELTTLQLNEKLTAGHNFYLIDVRENHEWQLGRLPKAILLNLNQVSNAIEQIVVDKTATVVFYCGSGYRSALAADTLQKMGYDNVWSLQGGIKAWGQAGFTVEV